MKLKISEMITVTALTGVICYSAATDQQKSRFTESGFIQKRILKEDSTVLIIDHAIAESKNK